MKFDKRRTYYLVLDTETANGLEQPLVYDCGYAIVDKNNNVYETGSYLIYDVFVLEKDLMQSAFYAEKIPMYEDMLKQKKTKMVTILTLRSIIYEVCKKWDVRAICAYNAYFDVNALNTTIRYITKSNKRWFLPYGVEVQDILQMARSVIGVMPTYRKFCESFGHIYGKGNKRLRMNAEVVYRFLLNDNGYKEEHTGLEDVLIESEIMAYCFKQKKPMKKILFHGKANRKRVRAVA